MQYEIVACAYPKEGDGYQREQRHLNRSRLDFTSRRIHSIVVEIHCDSLLVVVETNSINLKVAQREGTDTRKTVNAWVFMKNLRAHVRN